VKIRKVEANARAKEFELEVDDQQFTFPFATLRVMPTPDDPVKEVFPDPELGNEAFTYRLESGGTDTVHLDAVREVNLDPDYISGLHMHRLTVEARAGMEKSGLGIRQAARLMGTSPAQLYRLLDTRNCAKSFKQMVQLLHVLGLRVELNVIPQDESSTRESGSLRRGPRRPDAGQPGTSSNRIV